MKRLNVLLSNVLFWAVVCFGIKLSKYDSVVPWVAVLGCVMSLCVWCFFVKVSVVYAPEDILKALDTLYWKSYDDLLEDMMLAKGVGDTTIEWMFCKPSTGWMFVNLNNFVDEGLIEARKAVRLQNQVTYEYQLTGGGMHRKSDIIEAERHRALTSPQGILSPGIFTRPDHGKVSNPSYHVYLILPGWRGGVFF